MKQFFRFSIGYFALAALIVLLSRAEPGAVLTGVVSSSIGHAPLALKVAVVLLGVALLRDIRRGAGSAAELVSSVSFAAVGTLVFHAGFTLIKTSMPYILPFWADPALADLDRMLHLGTDPWRLVHELGSKTRMEWLLPAYMSVWFIPAICFPTFLATFDRNPARVRRFVVLYVLSWVLVGNVSALPFNSVGPVYYDRLLGGTRFADMLAVLETSPLGETIIPRIQDWLWHVHIDNGQAFGSGISAFPSVHVSVAMVAGLYAFERSRWTAPAGVAFVAVILFLSVYTGYHYAVDGYVSIIVMIGLWAWLRRRETHIAELAV